jgi:D-alanine-D-alanine ligase
VRVTVLHNAVSDTPTADERDVLVQVEVVAAALSALGHEVLRLPCSLDLASAKRQLAEQRPGVVFNLVEALDGSDRLVALAPSLLDALGLPYTGSSAEALFLTGSKLLAKERLESAGLPTPAWAVPRMRKEDSIPHSKLSPPYIIKAVWEHASFGLGDEAVVREGDAGAVQDQLRQRGARWGRPCFAEQYVEGREFNLSVLAGPDGPEVLPPAEIDFSAFPAGKPHLVGYRAKWDADSFEYHHTPRCFDFPAGDRPLLGRLEALARACWGLFDLGGYARVDFRVDEQGQPWVLEINANCCLSPDAGFAAAVERARIPFNEAVQRILDDALVSV